MPEKGPGRAVCGEITWLTDAGITTGYDDGSYRPGVTVSRGAMAAFLHRFDAHLDV